MFPEREILIGVNGPISYQIYFYRCRKNLMKIEDQKRLLPQVNDVACGPHAT